jgi:hypothetical protein
MSAWGEAMLTEPPAEPGHGLRNYVVVSCFVFLLAGLYLGSVFYSRWEQDRTIEQKAAAKQRSREQANAQRQFNLMGGNRFAILQFYADPEHIEAGATADLCYSVSNTKSVKLEPQSQPVWPAFIHCVQVSPRKTTTYTLTADDGAGHTKSATVNVLVR